MDLLEVLDQVRALLRNKGRLTYRILKAQFQLGDESLAALKETARGTGNIMYPILDASRAYATLGEMCDALREVWGEYQEPPVF